MMIENIDQAHKVLDKIKFKNAPLNVTYRLKSDIYTPGYVWLAAVADVTERDFEPKPESTRLSEIYDRMLHDFQYPPGKLRIEGGQFVRLPVAEESFIELAYALAKQLYLHELDEAWHFDDVRVKDPHAPITVTLKVEI